MTTCDHPKLCTVDPKTVCVCGGGGGVGKLVAPFGLTSCKDNAEREGTSKHDQKKLNQKKYNDTGA